MERGLRVAVAFACAAGFARGQATTIESVPQSGLACISGSSFHLGAINADGRYVLFVVNDDHMTIDALFAATLYLRDRQTGAVEVISVDGSGVPVSSGGSMAPGGVTPDGRYVVFDTADSQMALDDTNGVHDVYLRDRQLGTCERVSRGLFGLQGDGPSYEASITSDGRYVAFASAATNLVTGDHNAIVDAFVLDRWNGGIDRVSVGAVGNESDGTSTHASLSSDSRYVVFHSIATNLVSGDTNGAEDVFLRDRWNSTTTLVSHTPTGSAGNGASLEPQLTPDGRFVVFSSGASDLGIPGVGSTPQIYLRDLQGGALELVSATSAGGPASHGCRDPQVSADGRFVSFESKSSNLVAGDAKLRFDVFRRDRASSTTARVSANLIGVEGNGDSFQPRMSADGRHVAFLSVSTDLVALSCAATAGYKYDVFVRDADGSGTTASPYCAPKVASDGCTPRIGAVGAPSASGFDAFRITAEFVPPGRNGVLVWGAAAASTPFGGGTLCVAAPLHKTPLQSSGNQACATCACGGLWSFHLSQAYMANKAIAAGHTLRAQYLFRDKGYAPPNNVGMTNALSVTVEP